MFNGHRYASLLSLQIEMCKDAEMSLKVRILDNKEKIVNVDSYVSGVTINSLTPNGFCRNIIVLRFNIKLLKTFVFE